MATTTCLAKPSGFPSPELRRRTMGVHKRRVKSLSDLPDSDDVVFLRLNYFLKMLSKRMKEFETDLDSQVEYAYTTLHVVMTNCSRLSDEIIDVGKRQMEVMAEHFVQHMEHNFQDVLSAGETFPQKVTAGMKILEGLLLQLERGIELQTDKSLRRLEDIDAQIISTADKAAERIAIAVSAAKQRLLTYDELPFPWQENEYITRGYRFYETKRECIRSILKLHNETCNIWSHLLGFIFMLSIALYYYPISPSFELASTADRVLFSLFLVAAIKCLAASFVWHTFCNLACLKTVRSFACLDYSAISSLIACTVLTIEYCGFYCQPVAQMGYMALTVGLGLMGTLLPWTEWFDKKDNRPLRILFFVALSASAVLPMVHLCWERNVKTTMLFFLPIMKSVMAYAVGVVIYANRFPERVWRNVFDWTGGSHFLWHCCVFAGIITHYYALLEVTAKASTFACS